MDVRTGLAVFITAVSFVMAIAVSVSRDPDLNPMARRSGAVGFIFGGIGGAVIMLAHRLSQVYRFQDARDARLIGMALFVPAAYYLFAMVVAAMPEQIDQRTRTRIVRGSTVTLWSVLFCLLSMLLYREVGHKEILRPISISLALVALVSVVGTGALYFAKVLPVTIARNRERRAQRSSGA